jgi:peptidoglycan/xylan/chitin deacetylase (PgdA/CDA1 family)
MIDAVLHILKFVGGFHAARWLTKGALRILCYHGVWTAAAPHYGDKLFMQPDKFRRRVDFLSRHCDVLTLGDALGGLRRGDLPQVPVVITIDDGWYGTRAHAVPALHARKVPATIYVTTYYVDLNLPVVNVLVGYMFATTSAHRLDCAEVHPDCREHFALDSAGARDRAADCWRQFVSALPRTERAACLRKLAAALGVDYDTIDQSRTFHLMTSAEIRESIDLGMDVQLHTHRHTFPVSDVGALVREVEENRTALEQIGVRSLTHFCYPSGRYDIETATVALPSAGVESATTLIAGFNYPDTSVLELRRIADGQQTSDIRFEAEIAGIMEIRRNPRCVLNWAFARRRNGRRTPAQA